MLSRDQIKARVWGPSHHGTVRTVDNFVLQLRSKLERDPGDEATRSYLSGLKVANIFIARLMYGLFLVGQFSVSVWAKSTFGPPTSRLNEVARASINFGFVASLLLGENKLSVWILIFVVNSFFKQMEINKRGK